MSDDHQLGTLLTCNHTIKKLLQKGVTEFFPIQTQTYNTIYEGGDIIASDRTGSGKTIAFSLPVIQRLNKNQAFKKKGIKFLVLVPTRELAYQVAEEISSLQTPQNRFFVVRVFGGRSIDKQLELLQMNPKIVVATPGRLVDIIKRGAIDLSQLEAICLDEADFMLDVGFEKELDFVYDTILKENHKKIQNIFFSATIPDWVQRAAKSYMSPNYKFIDLIRENENKTSVTVSHECIYVDKRDTVSKLFKLIEERNPNGRTLVFTETKVEGRELEKEFEDRGIECGVLNSDVDQYNRMLRLKNFKDGKVKILVATDVAARGLDIPSVELVIQISPPGSYERYIHRSGRTGRAGKTGTCITMVSSL